MSKQQSSNDEHAASRAPQAAAAAPLGSHRFAVALRRLRGSLLTEQRGAAGAAARLRRAGAAHLRAPAQPGVMQVRNRLTVAAAHGVKLCHAAAPATSHPAAAAARLPHHHRGPLTCRAHRWRRCRRCRRSSCRPRPGRTGSQTCCRQCRTPRKCRNCPRPRCAGSRAGWRRRSSTRRLTGTDHRQQSTC